MSAIDQPAPFLVQTITDSHGTYEERWMVEPPANGVTFRITAEAWSLYGDRWVRAIHEWKAVA